MQPTQPTQPAIFLSLQSLRIVLRVSLMVWALLIGQPLCGQETGLPLQINHAIRLSWPAGTDLAYQIETTTNVLGDWTPLGPLHEGRGTTQEMFFEATGGERLFRVSASPEGCIGWLEGRWKGRLYPFPPATGDTDELSITNAQRSYWLHGLYDGHHTPLRLLEHTESTAIFQPTATNWMCPWSVVTVTLLNPTNAAVAFYEGDRASGRLGFLHPMPP